MYSFESNHDTITITADDREQQDEVIAALMDMIELFPELFPAEIVEGYRMKDMYWSKKQGIATRRIEIAGTAYTICPSFVMPYMTGLVDEVEKGLFLRRFSVPFWALSYLFGKDPMYWYRVEKSV